MEVDKEYQLQKQLTNVLAAYKTLEIKYDRVCESLNLATNKNGNEYWAWQGDGYDYIESLSCPVLIPADCLRSLLDDSFAQGLIEGYKLNKKFPWIK